VEKFKNEKRKISATKALLNIELIYKSSSNIAFYLFLKKNSAKQKIGS